MPRLAGNADLHHASLRSITPQSQKAATTHPVQQHGLYQSWAVYHCGAWPSIPSKLPKCSATVSYCLVNSTVFSRSCPDTFCSRVGCLSSRSSAGVLAAAEWTVFIKPVFSYEYCLGEAVSGLFLFAIGRPISKRGWRESFDKARFSSCSTVKHREPSRGGRCLFRQPGQILLPGIASPKPLRARVGIAAFATSLGLGCPSS